MTDNDDDDQAFQTEADRFKYAVERLAESPREVAGACLRNYSPTAIDVIAGAEDDVLEQAAGVFGDLSVYQALRFLAGLALTLRQAKKLSDLLHERAPA
jgi:hypothetical protein